MRMVFAVLLVLATDLFAQSVVPQAVKETLNLAPKMQRGDTQKYSLKVEILFVDDKGSPTRIKRNKIDYTQICLVNSPDSGVIYEVTVDSFTIGGMGPLEGGMSSRTPVDTLAGFTFRSQFRSRIPVSGDCYDPGIPLTKGHNYVEAYELLEDLLPTKLAEQLRYTAGRRLSQVGDTVTIALPKPICYKIPQVVDEHRIDQKPFRLTLSGLTSHRGKPCASISFVGDISPMSVAIYSTDTSSFNITGSVWVAGEYLVSLDKGQIVRATFRERIDSKIDVPDGTSKSSRTWSTYELIQKN